MSIKIDLELRPFEVPNYVSVNESPSARQEGFIEGRKFHLSELDEETLSGLCDEFRAQVFAKAGKTCPE